MSNTVNIDRVTKTSRRGEERVIEVWDNEAEATLDLFDAPFPTDPLELVRLVLAACDDTVTDMLSDARQNRTVVNVDGQTIEWERLEPLFVERD